jgi:hypothetical protein
VGVSYTVGYLAGLSSDELTKKIRYLTLATLCSTSTSGSGEVSYKEIAQALEVDEKDVEVWVIDSAFPCSSTPSFPFLLYRSPFFFFPHLPSRPSRRVVSLR